MPVQTGPVRRKWCCENIYASFELLGVSFRLFCQFDTRGFVKIAASMNDRLFSFLNPLPYRQICLNFVLSFCSGSGVFGPPGSLYGSGSGFNSGSFYQQSKKLFCDFLLTCISLRTDVNVPVISKKLSSKKPYKNFFRCHFESC